MSSKKAGENPAHRKLKVSWATQIDPGLVGPKARPKGVVDGQQVNIPALPYGYHRATLCRIALVFWLYTFAAARPCHFGGKAQVVERSWCASTDNERKGRAQKNRDVTSYGTRTENRHRWVGTIVLRRTRETSLRNSAN